jgi:ABC-type sugar transport system ATPase subunit
MAFRPDEARGAALRRRDERQVVVGIRPQNLSVNPLGGGASVAATVILNEYLGEQSILTLDANGIAFRALATPDVQLTAGMAAVLHYRPEDVMIFDPRTELLVR